MRIENLTIQNFKCFRGFEVADLKRVNLIGGENNTGKTAFLEAISAHRMIAPSIYRITDILRVEERGFRRYDPEDTNTLFNFIADNLTNYHEQSNEFSVSFKFTTGERREFKIEFITEIERILEYVPEITEEDEYLAGAIRLAYFKNGKPLIQDIIPFKLKPFTRRALISYSEKHEITIKGMEIPIYFSRAGKRASDAVLAQEYSDLVKAEKSKFIVETVRGVYPEIKDCQLLIEGVNAYLGIVTNTLGLKHLSTFGEGLRKSFEYLLGITATPDGIFLIDEFENGIYYLKLRDVWKIIFKLAREFDVQVLATTHSRECIKAAYEASREDMEDDFAYFDFKRRKGEVEAVRYDKDKLSKALEMGWAIR